MDRYEKALELARAYYDKDANAFLDTIFPELKENRDEQIRKAIIKSLDMPFPEDNLPGTDVTYEEAVSWLEKQKEPVPIPDKFSGLKSLMLQYLQFAANRKDDAEIERDTDLWGRKILDYVWKYDEKQKEQKPAEWSEEDEKQIRQIERIVKDAGCSATLQEKIHNWFKSLRPSWRPSEEQIEALERASTNKYLSAKQFDILVSLYEQLKQL